MRLPDSFLFTQQNLQNYKDCSYRFYLKEILKLDWPAVESEPVREQEELMKLGSRFHLLCQQYFSGIPVDVLTDQITQPDLSTWWQNFLQLGIPFSNKRNKVEQLTSIPFLGYRLGAKFDLLALGEDGRILIYDWKTSQHQPKRQTILARMQSKVYPLVVAHSEKSSNKKPESIEMIYWYPEFPGTPIQFTYSQSQMDQDLTELELVVKEILDMDELGFEKTINIKICHFCRYRSLCDRGTSAGINEKLEDPTDQNDVFDLDFDAI